jgi:alpha-ketoglutarate-dependent taurine dioxygenase
MLSQMETSMPIHRLKSTVSDHLPSFTSSTNIGIAPTYSMLRMEEHPPVGGDTAWVSQYGLYDALSDAMKRFVDGLHAVHTSRLQCKFRSPAHLSVITNLFRRYDSRFLAGGSQQTANRHPSSSSSHPSSDRSQSPERKWRLCNRLC